MNKTDTRESADQPASPYASALLQSSGRVPYDDVDWEAFHARLAAAAELSLARLRHPHIAVASRPLATNGASLPLAMPWWYHAARWSRLVVAGSVAAGIALIIVVRASPKETDTLAATVATVATSPETEGRRAAFESAAIGRGAAWSIESALLPSAADLLVPLGKRVPSQ